MDASLGPGTSSLSLRNFAVSLEGLSVPEDLKKDLAPSRIEQRRCLRFRRLQSRMSNEFPGTVEAVPIGQLCSSSTTRSLLMLDRRRPP